MVTRRRKLFAAGIVLVIGFGLAWPLRRTEPLLPASLDIASAAGEAQVLAQPVILDEKDSRSSQVASTALTATGPLAPAKAARDPFADAPTPSAETSASPPIYSTISGGAGDARPSLEVADPRQRIHVVHQGDSLDRLAKRYLGDEARALEIFDLNREVLENPHLLPIGAELQIPVAGPSVED